MSLRKRKWLGSLCVCLALCGLAFSVTSCDFGASGVDQELPDDDPDREVTITFWHCLGDEKEDTLEDLVAEFNEEYEGKYEVVINKLAGSYDDLHDTIMTRLAANEVPALAMGYPDSFAEYISNDISESFLLRIDNFINDEDFGYSEEELDDFVDAYLDEGRHYQFSGTWSMPMYKSTECVYYNENYFAGENPQTNAKFSGTSLQAEYTALINDVAADEAAPTDEHLNALRTFVEENDGYTYEVPVTWDEMIALGRQMMSDRAEQNITDDFCPIGYDSDSNMLISQFEQRGIGYTQSIDEETEHDASDHILFNNDEAKEFVSEVTSLIREGILVTKNALGGNTYTNEYFTEWKAAMVIGSTGGSDYNVSSNFGVGLAAVPYYVDDDGVAHQQYIMQGPSICFFNNEDPYVHKGAWLFYKFIADPENNCYLALENSYDPVRKSSYELEMYESWLTNAGRGDLKYDIPVLTSELKDYYMTSPVFKGSSTCRDQIGEIISSVIMSGMSIDDAFTAAYNTCVRSID